MDTPGSRIKALRSNRDPKLTQEDLAALIGVDQSTISDIENGRGLSAENMMRICEVLQVPPQFIMRGNSNADALLMQVKAIVDAATTGASGKNSRDGETLTKVVISEPNMDLPPKNKKGRLGLREFQVTGKGLTDETSKAGRVSKQRSSKRA